MKREIENKERVLREKERKEQEELECLKELICQNLSYKVKSNPLEIAQAYQHRRESFNPATGKLWTQEEIAQQEGKSTSGL
jgi:predicted RNA-binding protein (virulence factor B family)